MKYLLLHVPGVLFTLYKKKDNDILRRQCCCCCRLLRITFHPGLFLKNEKHGLITKTVYQQVQNRTQTIPLWALAYKKSSKQNLES